MIQLETETTGQKMLHTENGASGLSEIPRGDGYPVLIVPPVLRSDKNMENMKDWLSSYGFKVFESGIEDSRKRDPRNDILGILSRIDKIFEQTGQKITLVGLSLGGIYTFVSAMYRPEKIQRVILVGTPIRKHVAEAAKGPYKEIAGAIIDGNASYNSFLSAIPTASMPYDYDLICMYSKDDEAFNWEDCFDERAQLSIEISGQHRSLHKNPQVFNNVTDICQTPVDKVD